MTHLPTTENNAYYPSKKGLAALFDKMIVKPVKNAILPGHIARTDGLPIDSHFAELETMMVNAKNDRDKKQLSALISRSLSLSDLTPDVYARFSDNPNSLPNWFPQLQNALAHSYTDFKTPATKHMRLPIELAQFIRLEYQTTSKENREWFNNFLFEKLELEDDKTYFIKTGTFSSKFQFANAKCAEPREMGEYFQVINNFAMTVGAGQSVDIVVREYIEDVENNPTIYNGMPLRTEFRVFVDCDSNEVIGTVPYWHPIVMKRALKHGLATSIQQDYQTYLAHEDKLTDDYNAYHGTIERQMKALVPALDLKGRWSIDVMKNGDELYIIDMALMDESALVELLPENTEM